MGYEQARGAFGGAYFVFGIWVAVLPAARAGGGIDHCDVLFHVRAYHPEDPQQGEGTSSERDRLGASTLFRTMMVSNALYGSTVPSLGTLRPGAGAASIDVASIAVARSLAPYSLEVH